jgi:hypothetical protein
MVAASPEPGNYPPNCNCCSPNACTPAVSPEQRSYLPNYNCCNPNVCMPALSLKAHNRPRNHHSHNVGKWDK